MTVNLVFTEISVSYGAILTLNGRESDDREIWAKISISKTRFDAWSVFATDFSIVVKSQIFFSILDREKDLTDRSLSSFSGLLRVKRAMQQLCLGGLSPVRGFPIGDEFFKETGRVDIFFV